MKRVKRSKNETTSWRKESARSHSRKQKLNGGCAEPIGMEGDGEPRLWMLRSFVEADRRACPFMAPDWRVQSRGRSLLRCACGAKMGLPCACATLRATLENSKWPTL